MAGAPVYTWHLQVEAKALKHLKEEGLEKSEQVVSKNGAFYNDLLGYAMNHFAFFQCYEVR